jgi:hypothetical protein
VTVDPGQRDTVTSAELVATDKRTIPLSSFKLDPRGGWGGAIPVTLSKVASVRLLAERPGEILHAPFIGGAGQRRLTLRRSGAPRAARRRLLDKGLQGRARPTFM